MDGLDTSNNGVIVMAATNRAELLDPALLRAGRFDRIIQCPLPDRMGRLQILYVHTRRLSLAKDVDLDRVARLTPGTCGADLATIANEGICVSVCIVLHAFIYLYLHVFVMHIQPRSAQRVEGGHS
jgi:cell division protease FtsH